MFLLRDTWLSPFSLIKPRLAQKPLCAFRFIVTEFHESEALRLRFHSARSVIGVSCRLSFVQLGFELLNTGTPLVANMTEPLDSPHLFLNRKPTNTSAKSGLVVLDQFQLLSSMFEFY